MQPSEIANPRVHDLLHIDVDSRWWTCVEGPKWIGQTLASCPWVVVRRAQAPTGQIAVGVRGRSRGERWGCFIRKGLIRKVVSPVQLGTLALAPSHNLRTPPFLALQQLSQRWCDLTLPWGPTGSLGFELATGRQATTSISDLDIAIRADERISREYARSLLKRTLELETKVDIRVETPECGFSLEEYASTLSSMLLRYPDHTEFGNDPWSKALQPTGGAK